MAHFELLEVVNVDIKPIKGRLLAKLFAEWVGDHYRDPKDPEIINARNIHFKVDATEFSPLEIMDFLHRLPDLKEAGKLGEVSLEFNKPESLSSDALHRDTLRVLRSFIGHGEKIVWTNQEGSLLDHTSVVDLLFQYFLRDQYSQATIKALQEKLKNTGPA